MILEISKPLETIQTFALNNSLLDTQFKLMWYTLYTWILNYSCYLHGAESRAHEIFKQAADEENITAKILKSFSSKV